MGREGQGWRPLAGRSLAHPTKQVFDTLCGRVRQDAGGVGAQVSVAAAFALSALRWGAGLGARVCDGVL